MSLAAETKGKISPHTRQYLNNRSGTIESGPMRPSPSRAALDTFCALSCSRSLTSPEATYKLLRRATLPRYREFGAFDQGRERSLLGASSAF